MQTERGCPWLAPLAQAGFAELSAVAGLSHLLDDEGEGELWLEAGYDFSALPSYADLSSHRGSLDAGAVWELTPDLALRPSASAALLAFGDSARDAFSAGGALALRVRIRDWLTSTLRGGYTTREARDDTFGYEAIRAGLSVSLTLSEALDLTTGYALTSADVVVYTTSSTGAVQGQRRGRSSRVDTFGGGELAVREAALSHTLYASLGCELPHDLFATASYAGDYVRADLQSYLAHVFALRSGIRFD